MAGNCHSLREAKMKHLAGEPWQSTCLTTDECRGWPDSRPQKVKHLWHFRFEHLLSSVWWSKWNGLWFIATVYISSANPWMTWPYSWQNFVPIFVLPSAAMAETRNHARRGANTASKGQRRVERWAIRLCPCSSAVIGLCWTTCQNKLKLRNGFRIISNENQVGNKEIKYGRCPEINTPDFQDFFLDENVYKCYMMKWYLMLHFCMNCAKRRGVWHWRQTHAWILCLKQGICSRSMIQHFLFKQVSQLQSPCLPFPFLTSKM
jgi:hypothetical protein